MKIIVKSPEETAAERKVNRLRKSMPGYILGERLTPYATDAEVLEICELKDKLAELHNRAFGRLQFGEIQHEA